MIIIIIIIIIMLHNWYGMYLIILWMFRRNLWAKKKRGSQRINEQQHCADEQCSSSWKIMTIIIIPAISWCDRTFSRQDHSYFHQCLNRKFFLVAFRWYATQLHRNEEKKKNNLIIWDIYKFYYRPSRRSSKFYCFLLMLEIILLCLYYSIWE